MDDTRDDPRASSPEEIDWPLMARFVAGETQPGDAAAVGAWIGDDASRRALVESLKDSWIRTGKMNRAMLKPAEVDAAWTRMANRLDARDAPIPLSPRVRRLGIPVRIAAGLLLVAGGMLIWRATQRPAPIASVEPAAARTFATGAGQRRTISLADGTEIVLAPATTIRIAPSYDSGARSLVLQGEALFRVRHDATRPFIVWAGDVVTEDLGTQFTIRAYDPGEPVRVAVAEGSVGVRNERTASSASAVVRAGQFALISIAGAPTIAPMPNSEAFLAWTNGQLLFDNTPLTSVAAELKRWYGVQVDIATPALGTRRLSATFGSEPFPEVLREIAAATGTTVTQSGNRVTFSAAAPAPAR